MATAAVPRNAVFIKFLLLIGVSFGQALSDVALVVRYCHLWSGVVKCSQELSGKSQVLSFVVICGQELSFVVKSCQGKVRYCHLWSFVVRNCVLLNSLLHVLLFRYNKPGLRGLRYSIFLAVTRKQEAPPEPLPRRIRLLHCPGGASCL